VPIIISHRVGHHFLNQILGYVLNGVVTVAMILSLARLLSAVTDHTIAPNQLLLSAGALWLSNILVFASWYWRLDGGGPHERASAQAIQTAHSCFPR
jgi:hypothetical protein